MLKIRLQRIGRKNDAHFRMIVTPSTYKPQTHKYLEIVGTYNVKAGTSELNAERIKHWMSQGAQVSDTVHNMLVAKKIVEGKKINVLPKKSPIKKESK
jgi:small subunit ribosomal protein S16